MSQFVESLKRLYDDEKIDKAKVVSLRDDGKITTGDMQYILNETKEE